MIPDQFSAANCITSSSIELAAEGSAFIVFLESPAELASGSRSNSGSKPASALNGVWKVKFNKESVFAGELFFGALTYRKDNANGKLLPSGLFVPVKILALNHKNSERVIGL